jgi:hypothetical protein
MFSGGAYSRYSALENPYIVRKTTDAGSNPREAYMQKQVQKKKECAAAISIRTAEAKTLMNHLNTEKIQNKPEKFKSDLRKGMDHASRMAKAAEKRVVHYDKKIAKLKGDKI